MSNVLGLTAIPSALDVDDEGRRRSALIAACVAVVGFSVQQTAPIPAFPTIELQLHAPARWTTWLLSGYLIVAAVSAPLFGKLGDRRGKRRMLLEVLAVYFLGSVGAALAPDIWALICVRALQGVGGAVFPLCIAILRDELRDEDVGRGIGALSGAFGVGAILSFGLTGLLTDAALLAAHLRGRRGHGAPQHRRRAGADPRLAAPDGSLARPAGDGDPGGGAGRRPDRDHGGAGLGLDGGADPGALRRRGRDLRGRRSCAPTSRCSTCPPSDRGRWCSRTPRRSPPGSPSSGSTSSSPIWSRRRRTSRPRSPTGCTTASAPG
jgi:hypothetical protein